MTKEHPCSHSVAEPPPEQGSEEGVRGNGYICSGCAQDWISEAEFRPCVPDYSSLSKGFSLRNFRVYGSKNHQRPDDPKQQEIGSLEFAVIRFQDWEQSWE